MAILLLPPIASSHHTQSTPGSAIPFIPENFLSKTTLCRLDYNRKNMYKSVHLALFPFRRPYITHHATKYLELRIDFTILNLLHSQRSIRMYVNGPTYVMQFPWQALEAQLPNVHSETRIILPKRSSNDSGYHSHYKHNRNVSIAWSHAQR